MRIKARPSCPYCHAQDVVPYTPRPFILAGVGGLLGGALMVALAVAGRKASKSAIVNSAVFGALTGASIGFSVHTSDHSSPTIGRRYLCCRCFRTFTYFKHTVS